MLNAINHQRSSPGLQVKRSSSHNSLSRNQTPEKKLDNQLKYISRKDKTKRLIESARLCYQFINDFDPDAMKIPPHQTQSTPEENHQFEFNEQSFKDIQLEEESPKQLSVKMDILSPKRQLLKHKPNASARIQSLASPKKSRYETSFDERSFIKKNFDQYSRTSEKSSERSPNKTKNASLEKTHPNDSQDIELPSVFSVLKAEMSIDADDNLNESFVKRLNEKYQRAYMEANGNSSNRKFEAKQRSASNGFVMRNIPFVDDDTTGRKELITSLMVPQIAHLTYLSQRLGPFSQVENIGEREPTSANQSRSPKKKNDGSQRLSSPSKIKKENTENKNVFAKSLIENFDKNYAQVRDLKAKELMDSREISRNESHNSSATQQLKSRSRSNPLMQEGKKAKSINSPNRFQRQAETEDFILELTNHVTQCKGLISARHQSKLLDLVSQIANAKQNNSIKSKVTEFISRENSHINKRILNHCMDNGLNVHRQDAHNISELSVMMAYLDDLSSRRLTAKYLDV